MHTHLKKTFIESQQQQSDKTLEKILFSYLPSKFQVKIQNGNRIEITLKNKKSNEKWSQQVVYGVYHRVSTFMVYTSFAAQYKRSTIIYYYYQYQTANSRGLLTTWPVNLPAVLSRLNRRLARQTSNRCSSIFDAPSIFDARASVNKTRIFPNSIEHSWLTPAVCTCSERWSDGSKRNHFMF